MHVILNSALRFVFEAEYHTTNNIKAAYANLRIGTQSDLIFCETTLPLDETYHTNINIFASMVNIHLMEKTFYPTNKMYFVTNTRNTHRYTDRRNINCVLASAIANAIDYYTKHC